MALDPTDLRQTPQIQLPPGAQTQPTPEELKNMYAYAKALTQSSQQPIRGRHPWIGGIANMVDALVGGYTRGQADKLGREPEALSLQRGQRFIPQPGNLPPNVPQGGAAPGPTSMLGVDPLTAMQDTPQPVQVADASGVLPTSLSAMFPEVPPSGVLPGIGNYSDAPSSTETAPKGGALKTSATGSSDLLDRAQAATSKQESGGRYNEIGPMTKYGQALGKYQIIPENVKRWSKEVLGRELTPQQFLADQAAQDQIYRAKMNEYITKYGVEGAGRAWLGGEGSINRPDRRDVLGTSVGDYGRNFAKLVGPGGAMPPPAVAAPAGAPVTAALPFSGQPAAPDVAGSAPSAADAINMALSGQTAATSPAKPAAPKPQTIQAPVTGTPTGQFVPPGILPGQSRATPTDLNMILNNRHLDPAVKAFYLQQYMGTQVNPRTVPYSGGNIYIGPDGTQWAVPDVHWGTQEGPGGTKRPLPQYILPPSVGGSAPLRSIEEPSTKPPVKGGAPDIKPPTIGPGSGPASTPAPAATPPARPPGPTGAVPTTVVPPEPPPVPPVGTVGQAPTNQVASNMPMATEGVPVAPKVAETGVEALGKAQESLPPQSLSGEPPIKVAGPMGQRVSEALETQPPTPAKGTKTAESMQEWEDRMYKQAIDLKHREALATQDAKDYQDSMKTILNNSGPRAANAIAQLQLALKMTQDPRFYSGPAADFVQFVQKARAILGKDPGMAAPMEIFTKIISGDIVQELKQQLQGLGQIRLAEIQLVNQSVANLYNTEAANKAVLDIMLRTNQQSAKIGEIARAYSAGWRWDDAGKPYRSDEAPTNAGLSDAIAKYTTNNPLFTDQEIAQAQQTFNIAQQGGKAKPNPKYEPFGNVVSPSPSGATGGATQPSNSDPAGLK